MTEDDTRPEDQKREDPNQEDPYGDDDGYLAGHLLIAMPSMLDPRFSRTVIYLCAHNEEGAMGLVINRLIGSLTFTELLDQLNVKADLVLPTKPVHFGGPVETTRGFVLHSSDFVSEESVEMDQGIALTATMDILRLIAEGEGPSQSIMALGYAGWGPGQLEKEIQENAWLSVKPDMDLLFGNDLDDKWDQALAKLGISAHLLSGDAGHA
ncbi:MAG: YqgE/AlgH family protein [Alphaproteobacteria bacterium]|nr:YqgE/AlgH family protein [Alphaproteobacteria bacterium]